MSWTRFSSRANYTFSRLKTALAEARQLNDDGVPHLTEYHSALNVMVDTAASHKKWSSLYLPNSTIYHEVAEARPAIQDAMLVDAKMISIYYKHYNMVQDMRKRRLAVDHTRSDRPQKETDAMNSVIETELRIYVQSDDGGFHKELAAAAARNYGTFSSTDPKILRRLLKERLEIAGRERRRFITNTPLDDNAPPSCDNQAQALMHVSYYVQEGLIELETTDDDLVALQTVYDKAEATIGRLTATDAPVWYVGKKKVGSAVTLSHDMYAKGADGKTVFLSGDIFVDQIRAESQHDSRLMRMPVELHRASFSAQYPAEYSIVSRTTRKGIVTMMWRPGGFVPLSPRETRVVLRARNVCGPSELEVNIVQVDNRN